MWHPELSQVSSLHLVVDPLILTRSPSLHWYWWSFQVFDTWWCYFYPDSPAHQAAQQQLWPSSILPKFLLQPLLWDVHLAIWREDKGPSQWELTPLLPWQYHVHLLFLKLYLQSREWGRMRNVWRWRRIAAFRWFVQFPMSTVKAKLCTDLYYAKSLTSVCLYWVLPLSAFLACACCFPFATLPWSVLAW